MIRKLASHLAILALILGACGREPVSSSRAHFEELRTFVRSESASTRVIGAASMLRMCCPTTGARRPEADEACAEVKRLLEVERDHVVVEELLFPWGPDCHREIAPSVLIELLARQKEIPTRQLVVDRLGEVEPSPAVVEALLGQLGGHGRTGRYDVHTSAVLALAAMGEEELGPVVESLTSRDLPGRRGAARALAIATKAPLDLPSAKEALEDAAADPDPDTAEHARLALTALAARGVESADAAVARLLEDRSVAPQTIRFLALRRFSCASDAAAAALEGVRAGDDPDLAAAAARAIALRARRCAR